MSKDSVDPAGGVPFPVHIRLRPSRRARLAVFALHLPAVALLLSHPLLGPLQLPESAAIGGLFLLLALLFSLWRNLRKVQALAGELVLNEDGCAHFDPARAAAAPAENSPAAAFAPVDFGWALWFSLQRGTRPQRFMLWRDTCSPEHWRLLRLWLRHKVAAAPVSEEAP